MNACSNIYTDLQYVAQHNNSISYSAMQYIPAKCRLQLLFFFLIFLIPQFTPVFGIICVILIILILREPNRGQAETGNQAMSNTNYVTDLRALFKK